MNAIISALGGIRASVFAALMLVFAGLFAWKAHQATATATQFRAYQDRMIALTAAAQEKAHQARDTFMTTSLDNERAYQREKDDAKVQQDSVVAAARTGELRFRQLWQGCVSTASLSGAVAAAAGGADGQAGLRAEAAGRIVRVGADADNHVSWLQAELIATRALAQSCGAP